MRILLAQNASYLFNAGGTSKANRLLMEGLARLGHQCLVVATARTDSSQFAEFLADLQNQSMAVLESSSDQAIFTHEQVRVRAVRYGFQLQKYMQQEIKQFNPHWVLVSEDLSNLLEGATAVAPGRVVYISHSSSSLPFGPYSFFPNPAKAYLFPQLAGILTVSQYMKNYLKEWGKVESEVIPFPVYGSEQFPNLASFEQGYVTLINPCAIKGISIFIELAQQFPQTAFAAVPTWATTPEDLAQLQQYPNITLLKPTANIEQLLQHTKILLTPSLWDEAFGLVSVEAMLRGIPVVSSDMGGLPEAKLGVPYVIPVNPIRYVEGYDARAVRKTELPAQNLNPWVEALTHLLQDKTHYHHISQTSYQAAHKFVAPLSPRPFAHYLEQLTPKQPHTPAGQPTSKHQALLQQLSPEKQALLLQRLRQISG